jgi:hypothetical protein
MSGSNGDKLHLEATAVLERGQAALTGRDSRSVHCNMAHGFSLPIRLPSDGVDCPEQCRSIESLDRLPWHRKCFRCPSHGGARPKVLES